MADDRFVSSGEFERWTTSLERQMREGFDRITAHFDTHAADDRSMFAEIINKHSNLIVRLVTLEERIRMSRRHAQGWGAGIGAAVAALITLLSLWLERR